MGKFFHNKDLIFRVIGGLLFILLTVIVIYLILFLSRQAADAFGEDLIHEGDPVKFNLDKLQNLSL